MEWLRATYHIAAKPQDIQARAEALAIEQSIEMPVLAVQHPNVLEEILGRVEAVEPVGENRFRVVLELSVATTGFEVGQLLNVLFGNCSLQEDVELVDVDLPPALLSVFSGPKFGLAGLREIVGAYDRPLTCTALKPGGISPEDLAKLAYTFALGGLDFIKDDHGIANQAYSPFAARVAAVQKAVEAANRETGGKSCYAPNLSGSPETLLAQAQIAREEGIKAVMMAPMLVGLLVFYQLVQELKLPVLAHPAFAGLRIAPPVFFGKLFRLFGADAVIYPNYGGRFSYSQQTCAELAGLARASWGHVLSAMPVPAGGMTVERVREMLEFYGRDSMLLIGGGLLSAGDKLLEKSREFVQKVAGVGV